jgi:hypothetical protein
VTVEAAYSKNGQTATLFVPSDLAKDLATYVARIETGATVFPLPHERGAEMIRVDLRRAGVPYRDEVGRVFGFHSLRCECATLADAAGVSPRVVQALMRHSDLRLTGRYTRPRVVDIEAAASMLPTLKRAGSEPGPIALTGTDPDPVRHSTPSATDRIANRRKMFEANGLGEHAIGSRIRRPGGSPS